ncbi:MAG: trigger factor [Dehalococcoidales bacterium]|mgnify:CR=1 FL=1|jgi:trigger factor
MKSTLDKTENHMSYLTVVNEISEMEGYMEKAYQRLVKRTEVPGFRKGNAPRDILEKHVGREKLLEDAIREAVPFICDDVIKEHNLEPVMQPMVKIVENEPLKFEMIVALKPTVELGDYKNMVVEPEPLEVSDEELNEVLDNLRKQYGGSAESSDSPIKYGDNITADIVGEVYESPIIRNKGITFELNSEFAKEIPGLADKLVGMKKGEESKFKLTLPDDYENKVVAGKEVEFTVTIKDVRGMTLPELDDEFAKKVSPGIESLEALKDRIRTNLKSEKERNAVANYEEKVIEKLIEISKLEYPPVMIDMELQDLIEEYKRQLQASCRDEKEFEERMKQVPEAKLRENGKPMAKKRVLWTLVVSEVAKQEEIAVSEQEVDEEIESMLKDAGQRKEEMRKYLQESNGRREVESFLHAKKTIKQLVEMVKANTPSEN